MRSVTDREVQRLSAAVRSCGLFLFSVLCSLTFLGCGEEIPRSPSGFSKYTRLDPRSVIDGIAVCVWREDAKAACSVAFDDHRWTHINTAAPLLEARGLRGTFNLNTGAVRDWSPWQALFDKGHEIGNHTRNHLLFSELSESEIVDEVTNGLDDILTHIRGIQFVPTFTFPGGSSSIASRSIVSRYHMNARGSWGVNPSTPADFMLVKGCGYNAPHDLSQMCRDLNRVLRSGGWFLIYHHSISDSDPSHCPVAVFESHLDYIVDHLDSLWVAPQGEVARYIRERNAFRYEILGESEHWLRIETGLEPALYDVPLTIRIFGCPGHSDLRFVIGDAEVDMRAGLSSVILDVIPEMVLPLSVYQIDPP
jgi:peptidoglycan/xylan/chitin deacetylase (PgdA/CDA1 family)